MYKNHDGLVSVSGERDEELLTLLEKHRDIFSEIYIAITWFLLQKHGLKISKCISHAYDDIALHRKSPEEFEKSMELAMWVQRHSLKFRKCTLSDEELIEQYSTWKNTPKPKIEDRIYMAISYIRQDLLDIEKAISQFILLSSHRPMSKWELEKIENGLSVIFYNSPFIDRNRKVRIKSVPCGLPKGIRDRLVKRDDLINNIAEYITALREGLVIAENTTNNLSREMKESELEKIESQIFWVSTITNQFTDR